MTSSASPEVAARSLRYLDHASARAADATTDDGPRPNLPAWPRSLGLLGRASAGTPAGNSSAGITSMRGTPAPRPWPLRRVIAGRLVLVRTGAGDLVRQRNRLALHRAQGVFDGPIHDDEAGLGDRDASGLGDRLDGRE